MIIKITIIFVIINDPITPSLFFQDLLYSPHFSRFQPYFDAVGVAGGFGEYPIDITLGEGAGALVFASTSPLPAVTMRAVRKKKALLDGYADELRKERPARAAVQSVRRFLEGQLQQAGVRAT